MVSVSATQIVVDVDGISSGTVAEQMEVYLGVGVVTGFDTLLNGVIFEPVLLSLTSSEGSEAGGIIRATVAGAGVNDNLTLVETGSSNPICQSATMIEYGILECVLNENT